MKITPIIAAALMTLALTACGGGGDSSEGTTDGGTVDGGTDGGGTGNSGTDDAGTDDGGTDDSGTDDGGTGDGGTDDGGTDDGGTDDGGTGDGGTDDGGTGDGGTDDGGTDDGGTDDGGTDDGGTDDGGTDDGGTDDGGTDVGGTDDGGTDDGGTDDGGTDDGGTDDGGTDDGGTDDGGTDDGGTDDGGTDDGGTDGNAENGDNGFIGVVSQSDPNFLRGSLGDNDSVPTINCDETVSTASEVESRLESAIEPGTTVCLANGTYTNLEINFNGTGTAESPITLAAANPGEVILTGETGVIMSGEYLVLQGLIFRDGSSANSDFLNTRGGSSLPCNFCRITEISIIDIDSGEVEGGRWLKLFGTDNRIDHSWFSGKTTKSTLVEIVRQSGFDGDEADRTQIDHNYFGNRAPTEGKAYSESGDNEFEAIRIGTSDTQDSDSLSVVEYNYFEAINGEAEVISNKSGSNTIRYNTIRNSYGSITTRHGANATIEGNVMIGDDHPFSGGLRIIDENHTIQNNYIAGARYQNTRFHGGIVIHNSDGSTGSGYQQVTNVLIANNTVVDSVNSLNIFGGNHTRKPENVYFVNNIISQGVGPVIVEAANGLPGGDSIFAGNTFYGKQFSDDSDLSEATGIAFVEANLEQDALGIWRPSDNSPGLTAVTDANIGTFPYPANDMDGQDRAGTTQSGADHISSETAVIGVLNSHDVGPINYRPTPGIEPVKQVVIANHDFDRGDATWTFADSLVTGEPSETFSRARSAKITDLTGKVSQDVSVETNTQYTLSAFVKGYGTLGVEIGTDIGVETFTTDNSTTSEYRFTTVTFNSGDNSSVNIFGSIDNFLNVEADIIDNDFVDFRNNGGTSDVWLTTEGDEIGYVSGSSNSASGSNGSATLGYSLPSHENGSPSISQNINDILPNTDYVLSFYVLQKNGSAANLELDIVGASDLTTSEVIASDIFIDYTTLDPATEADDGFLLYTYSFNSGVNTSVSVQVSMQAQAILGAQTPLEADGRIPKTTRDANEIRIDDFSLSYEGAPPSDTQAFFDSFRLVSHGND